MTALKKFKLSDFIDINPKVTLANNAMYSFVEMKDLNESRKYVLPSQIRALKGGARFQDGDTLFARITPCLENGKICQVKGLRSGVGYGSTEFLVFRGKKNVSITDFIYYLARYDVVRRFAEQNMAGTSGRQRVSKEAFENISLLLPDLPTQTAIAEILSSLDDKIELNNQINKELEALAQALFKHWFIDFEFPNEDGKPYKSSGGEMVESEFGEIPMGWTFDTINSIALNVRDGISPQEMDSDSPYIGLEHIPRKSLSICNWGKASEVDSQKSEYQIGDILFGKLRPYFHKVIVAPNRGVCSTDILVIRPKQEHHFGYLLFHLFSDKLVEFASSVSGGTRMPRVSWHDIAGYKILLPSKPLMKEFNSLVDSFIKQMAENTKENTTLSSLRDTLLPNLISGDLKISH